MDCFSSLKHLGCDSGLHSPAKMERSDKDALVS